MYILDGNFDDRTQPHHDKIQITLTQLQKYQKLPQTMRTDIFEQTI